MGKLINPTQENYTVVPRKVFEDTRLNFYAKGLLCTIYSLPTNQPVTIESLYTQVLKGDKIQNGGCNENDRCI